MTRTGTGSWTSRGNRGSSAARSLPRSLPLWLPDETYAGFGARSTDAATAAGLICRPLEQTLSDVLDWEVAQGPAHDDRAGRSPQEERQLIAVARN